MPENFSINERNKTLIKKYVSNHFGLATESNQRFCDLLDEPDIDEIYKQFLGNDLRVKFPIDQFALENYDQSWSLFKEYFPTYYLEFGISYRDYARGRIVVNKNELRIFKHLALYYLDTNRGRSAFHSDNGLHNTFSIRNTTNYFENMVNDIIKVRLPAKNKYEIVLSLNFADWFLCSTGESWTSCLNLESQYSPCYWSGLPGFIVDKNKAMLYITSGEKKEYLGIVTDKILTRTFLTLNKNNEIKALRWYPTDTYFSNGILETLPFEINYLDEYQDGIKYNLNPLFFKNGWTCFGYQDKTVFRYSSSTNLKNIPFDTVSKGGQFYINEDKQFEDHSIFCWSKGFRELMNSGSEIQNNIAGRCFICDGIINLEESYEHSEHRYCEECYNNLFTWCENCQTDFLRDNLIVTSCGNYCEECYSELFARCSNCGVEIHTDEVVEDENPKCSRCRNLT